MLSINLMRARSQLQSLNRRIKDICRNNLEIVVYTDINENPEINTIAVYDKDAIPDFVLCMNHIHNKQKHCISSISCKVNPEDFTVEFSSKTDPKYEGKKYNVLLRASLLLLSPYIQIMVGETSHRIHTVISRAINPISIYLLAKYFHAYNEKLEEYMEDNELAYDSFTMKDAKDFYENVDAMDEEFEDENAAAAFMKNNKEFGNPIIFTIDITNRDTIRRASHVFESTAINCPVIVFSGARTVGNKKISKTNKTKKRRTF
jgi:hypothetical protein